MRTHLTAVDVECKKTYNVKKKLSSPLTHPPLSQPLPKLYFIRVLFFLCMVVEVPSPDSEKCAAEIHKSCEKKIFYQMVVNHMPWPETTKWRHCYKKALRRNPCTAPMLQNYATLQQNFGERLRQREYTLGLFGIFMNDNKQASHQLL